MNWEDLELLIAWLPFLTMIIIIAMEIRILL